MPVTILPHRELGLAKGGGWRLLLAEHPLIEVTHEVAGGFVIDDASFSPGPIAVLLNANQDRSARYTLPDGIWTVLVDALRAGTEPMRSFRGTEADVPACSAMVLLRTKMDGGAADRSADTDH